MRDDQDRLKQHERHNKKAEGKIPNELKQELEDMQKGWANYEMRSMFEQTVCYLNNVTKQKIRKLDERIAKDKQETNLIAARIHKAVDVTSKSSERVKSFLVSDVCWLWQRWTTRVMNLWTLRRTAEPRLSRRLVGSFRIISSLSSWLGS